MPWMKMTSSTTAICRPKKVMPSAVSTMMRLVQNRKKKELTDPFFTTAGVREPCVASGVPASFVAASSVEKARRRGWLRARAALGGVRIARGGDCGSATAASATTARGSSESLNLALGALSRTSASSLDPTRLAPLLPPLDGIEEVWGRGVV
jgi:hypothetical protein